MHRVTMTLDDDLMQALDAFMHKRKHDNRSEAIRDLVRLGLQDASNDRDAAGQSCVGALVYVYDHDVRQLPERLTGAQHDHHDLCVSTLHVHLDHSSCMEVTVLRGERQRVEGFADALIAERGVRYGKLVAVPVDVHDEKHRHGGAPQVHAHSHVRAGK